MKQLFEKYVMTGMSQIKFDGLRKFWTILNFPLSHAGLALVEVLVAVKVGKQV